MRDPCLVNRTISLSFNFDRAIAYCEHAIRLDPGLPACRPRRHPQGASSQPHQPPAPSLVVAPHGRASRSSPINSIRNPGLSKHRSEIPTSLVRLMSKTGKTHPEQMSSAVHPITGLKLDIAPCPKSAKLGSGRASTPLLLCPQERTSAGFLDAAGLFQGITLPRRRHLGARGLRRFYPQSPERLD